MNLFIGLPQKLQLYKKRTISYRLGLIVLLFSFSATTLFAQEANYSVMEVVEVTFNSQQDYQNAYLDVDVWIELQKANAAEEVYKIPIFWDGGNTFRARLVATSPGTWSWKIINETVNNADPAFIDQSGSFTATAANAIANPNNHGFIRTAANNRTLEYADGTPFFFTADTSWSILTEVFGYDQANDITGISFKDYILARKEQGFNGMNVIASFPDDTYIGDYNKNKQFPNQTRGLWSDKTWGKKIGPNGATPFEMKAPSDAVTDWSEEVDYRKINPEYWQSVDQRMQFLSDEGFVTLFEAVRRHEQWPFRTEASEKDAFYNYMRYLWARYGCYNMIFSWVHLDSDPAVYKPWRSLVAHANEKLSEQLGDQMPYGQPRTAMSFSTTFTNWGNPNTSESQTYPGIPAALDVQNVSNEGRDERMHQWLNQLYDNIEQPAVNLEPFYAGWVESGDFNKITDGLDDTTMAQMQMYGSVLSGALAGHAWGDAWYAGAAEIWGTVTERMVPRNDPQVNALTSFESQSMGHLKTFVLDEGHEYGRLIPAADTHLSDSQNFVHTLAISDDEEFALGFFAGDSRTNPRAIPHLTNLKSNTNYLFEWWNVTTGGWVSAGKISTSGNGELQPPTLPNNDRTKNWAYRIRSEAYIGEEIVEEPVEEPVELYSLRINSGGDEIIFEGETFIADNYFDTGRTLDRPQTGLQDPFKTFRYSRSQVLGYDIPLENGEYTVKLHFAELWFGATGGGAGGVGNRVFDVRMEDKLMENNLDIFAEVGPDAMLTKSYTLTVTDGQLNLDFSSLDADGGTRHPVINAIEILEIAGDVNEEEEEIEEEEVEEEEVEEEELNGLIGHWPLDEQNGTYANDLSDEGRIGTLKNGLTFDTDKTGGKIEGAVEFNGVNERISLPDIDNHMQDGFTVSAWIKPSNAGGGYQGIVGSSTAGGFMMFIRKNKLTFKVTTNENGEKLIGAGSIQNNVWQLITCTYDGETMHWFIDGKNVHNESLPGTIKDKKVAWIGWSGWGEEFYQGAMDDVRLFNNALNEEQVLSLFENGHGTTAPAFLFTEEPEETDAAVHAYVYPNPTQGRFKITGLNAKPKEVIVLNFSGFKLFSFETAANEPEIDLSNYPEGVYIVTVIQNGLVDQSFKVVKE